MRLIDADALIMALRLEYPMIPMFKENQEEWEIKTEGYRKAEEVIKDAPTIEPKRGEWQYVYKGQWVFRRCSCCEWTQTHDDSKYMGYRYNFCPNCGADMREREGE